MLLYLWASNFPPLQCFNDHTSVLNSYRHPLWMAEQGKTITSCGFTKLNVLR